MTTISIVPETRSPTGSTFRAIAGTHQSTGRTPGEALDAIASQLDDRDSGTLLVVQHMRPDRFFNEDQHRRLADLMARWRAARDSGATFPENEQQALERLIDEELDGSAQRAAAMLGGLRP